MGAHPAGGLHYLVEPLHGPAAAHAGDQGGQGGRHLGGGTPGTGGGRDEELRGRGTVVTCWPVTMRQACLSSLDRLGAGEGGGWTVHRGRSRWNMWSMEGWRTMWKMDQVKQMEQAEDGGMENVED